MEVGAPAEKAWGFLTLPPELRNRIYRLTIGHCILHISEKPHLEGICYIGEKVDEDSRIFDIRARRSHSGFQFTSYTSSHSGCISNKSSKATPPTVALLCTSRITYQEANPIFYGSNEFHFLSVLALDQFLSRPQTTGCKLIRHITLLVDVDQYSPAFYSDLEPFLGDNIRRRLLKSAVSRLEGLKDLRLLLEFRESHRCFPNLSAALLLRDLSNLVVCFKTACAYHIFRDPNDRLCEALLACFEWLAVGGSSYHSSSGDRNSGGWGSRDKDRDP